MTRKKEQKPIREGAGWRVYKMDSPPKTGRHLTDHEGAVWYRVERAATSETSADEAFVALAPAPDGRHYAQWRKGGAGGSFIINSAVSFDDALDQVIKRALRGPTTWRTGPYQQPI